MSPAAQPPLPLRDIHLPEPVSWWPPAPGWWGLALLLLLLAGLFLWGRALYRRGRLRREARRALQRIERQYRAHRDDRQLAADLSVLLRRVALSEYPRAEVAGLTRDAWLGFLDEGVAGSRFQKAFTTGAGRALAEAPYRATADLEGPALLRLCAAWIDALPHKPHRPGRGQA